LAILYWQSVALGQVPSAADQARAHFQAGEALYKIGEYTEALREFEIGYALSRNSRFLLDVAQAQRKLKRPEKARDAFRKFLTEAPADDPDRATARSLLAEVDAELSAAPPSPPPTTSTPPPTKSTPEPAIVAARAAPPPRKRRGWIAAVVVGGALVVGSVLAIGLVYGTSPQYPNGLKVPVQ
jgi:tetratricopeptide (TPR) repeat protein